MTMLTTILSRRAIQAMAAFAGACVSVSVSAVTKDLPYPNGGDLTGEQVIEQVYFVNHSFAFDNVLVEKKGKTITSLVSVVGEGNPVVSTIVRYLNNSYDDGIVRARDMIIFKSGKIKGTGYLMTLFEDEDKSPSLKMWMPILRKVRIFAAPAQDDVCCSANLTYGDLFMRKPQDETHELVGVVELEGCLGTMALTAKQISRRVPDIPEAQCGHQGKKVYQVKSTSKFKNWWYDHRVSYVDTESFADYRVRYFKDGKEIKVFEKDWQPMFLEDKRAARPNYMYTHTYKKDIQSLIIIPEKTVSWDQKVKNSLWTEKTLRKLKR